MKYISFYTEGVYKEIFENTLEPTLKQHNLDYYVYKVEDQKSWYLNTAQKASVIKEALELFQEPVVFIDADAKVIQYPDLFNSLNCDIAVHYLDWYKFWKNEDRKSKKELLSGTLYFNYNKKVLDLLDKWVQICYTDISVVEQKKLQVLLDKNDGLDIVNLPVEYCTIIKKDGSIPKYIKNPVIIHEQASREFR